MQIWKEFDKRAKRHQWRARFRFNNKQFRLKHDTKDGLDELVAEIKEQERLEIKKKKYGLDIEIINYVPTVAEILNTALPTILKHHQKVLSRRVFELFLNLLPPMIKVIDLKKIHYQTYINHRSAQLGKDTKQPVKLQTIYKELYAIKSALKQAVNYDSLENWQIPELPSLPKGLKKRSRRERLISEKELMLLIDELMKPPTRPQDQRNIFHRVRLAHYLEFGYWTGLRRKEISRLKFSQFDEQQRALLNVRRWKTDTVTNFFPLGLRAIEIIEIRRELQEGLQFIFSPDGNPIESNYRTLKNVCKDLSIPYGRYADGGFIAHDLRHNFGTEILRGTDIETARELLGHSNISQTSTYVHTSNDRLTEAVRKRDKIDYDRQLLEAFNEVKSEKINERDFVKKMKKLFGLS